MDTHHTVEAATLTRVGCLSASCSYSLMGFFSSLLGTVLLGDPDSLFPDGPRLPQKLLML